MNELLPAAVRNQDEVLHHAVVRHPGGGRRCRGAGVSGSEVTARVQTAAAAGA